MASVIKRMHEKKRNLSKRHRDGNVKRKIIEENYKEYT